MFFVSQELTLTPEQTEEVREVFTLFDKDGDNTISVEHVGTVMRALGQYPTEEELDKVKAEILADGEWWHHNASLVHLVEEHAQ